MRRYHSAVLLFNSFAWFEGRFGSDGRKAVFPETRSIRIVRFWRYYCHLKPETQPGDGSAMENHNVRPSAQGMAEARDLGRWEALTLDLEANRLDREQTTNRLQIILTWFVPAPSGVALAPGASRVTRLPVVRLRKAHYKIQDPTTCLDRIAGKT